MTQNRLQAPPSGEYADADTLDPTGNVGWVLTKLAPASPGASPQFGWRAPSGGGSFTNLTNTVYVDPNTTVLPANRTGNIETPFATVQAALTALATTGGILKLMPGNYVAEGALALGAHPYKIECFVTQGNVAINIAVAVAPMVQLASITGTATLLVLNNIQCGAVTTAGLIEAINSEIDGNIAATQLQAFNAIFDGSVTLTTGIGHAEADYVDCHWINDSAVVSILSNEATLFVSMHNCVFDGETDINGAGGSCTLVCDAASYSQLLGNGSVFTNVSPIVNCRIISLEQDLDGHNFTLVNFSNDQSAVDLALTLNAMTSFPAFVLNSARYPLNANWLYQIELQVEVGIKTDADHSVNGQIDFTIQASVSTDPAGVATFSFNTVPVPNISYLPAALAGASAYIIPSAGGYTVQAQRPAGVGCHAWYYVYWTRIKSVL